MPAGSSARRRRLLLTAAVIVIVIVVAAAIAMREPLLRGVGASLVSDEALAPADIIVISVDGGVAGVLEAADLVRDGYAARVAVFSDPPQDEDLEFVRRGLPYPDEAARKIHFLGVLGVTAVEQIPVSETSTRGEGEVLPGWCDQRGFKSIILVSGADHSKRIRRVLDRSMRGHQTQVVVRGSRYSAFDPNRWWESRRGVRIAIVELQKLALDVVLHPLQ